MHGHSAPWAVRPGIRFLLLASLLATASLSVLASPGYWSAPRVLAPAVLADLALGLPLLGWLVLVRSGRMEAWRLPLLFVLGFALARWWIPAAHLDLAGLTGLAVLLVEGAVVAVVLLRIRRVSARYRAERARDGGRSARGEALRAGLAEVLGRRVADAAVTELRVLRYAVAGWGRAPARPGGHAFTLHRRDAWGAIVGALLLALAVETLALHLLLALWSPLAAWIATGLSAYSALWLLGDFHAARRNPCLVGPEGLRLRAGLRWRVRIPWEEVRGLHTEPPEEPSVSVALLGAPDLWIETGAPVLAEGLLGIRRRVRFVGVRLDEPEAFEAAVRARLAQR